MKESDEETILLSLSYCGRYLTSPPASVIVRNPMFLRAIRIEWTLSVQISCAHNVRSITPADLCTYLC